MTKKDDLIPTSLDGIINEFVQYENNPSPERDEHGRFISIPPPTRTAANPGDVWVDKATGATYARTSKGGRLGWTQIGGSARAS